MLKVGQNNKAIWSCGDPFIGGTQIAGGDPITVAGWLYTGALFNTERLFSLGSQQAIDEACFLFIGSSDAIYFRWNNTSGGYFGGPVSSGTTLLDNTLYHIAATFDGTDGSVGDPGGDIYINGSTTSTGGATGTGDAADSNGLLYIGCSNASAAVDYSNCYFGHVGVWKRVLSTAEILALSKGFTPDLVCPQSLYFYAPLLRSPWVDLIGGPQE